MVQTYSNFVEELSEELSPLNTDLTASVNNRNFSILDGELGNKWREMLNLCSTPRSRSEILRQLGLTNQTKNFKRYFGVLLEYNLLIMTIPSKPSSQNQKYQLSEKFADYLKGKK